MKMFYSVFFGEIYLRVLPASVTGVTLRDIAGLYIDFILYNYDTQSCCDSIGQCAMDILQKHLSLLPRIV